MSGWTVAVCSLGGVHIAHHIGMRRPWLAAVAGLTLAAGPTSSVALVGAAGLLHRRARLRAVRLAEQAARREVLLLAHGLTVAVSAGLGLLAALTVVETRLATFLHDEVASVRREAARSGVGVALATAEGEAGPLFRQLAVAHISGAAIGPAVTAYASEQQAQAASAAVQRARQLPVRMVVPLTLLMLPGFVLLMVGPTVVSSVARLFGAVTGQ